MANWQDNWKKGNALGSALGLASGAVSLFGSAFNTANPNTKEVEQVADTQVNNMKMNHQDIQANSLDDLMNQWISYRPINTDINASDYYNGPSDGNIFSNTLSSTMTGATSGASLGPIGALVGGIVGLGSGLVGGLFGKSKAQKAAEDAAARVKAEAERQNAFTQASFNTQAQSLNSNNNRMLASQIAAYGGLLGLPFASGGAMNGYGGNWSNGLSFVNEGGSHEENPLGGVPMGIAQDGQPNLVEEGEVIWNDYVFSNRLTVPEEVKKSLGIKGSSNMTFADAVKKQQKASSERPNDSIEKRTLDSVLSGLQEAQETVRQQAEAEEQYNQMEDAAAYAADGGPIHIAKNKRGTFTAAATKNGMGVQEFASHVLSNKDKYSPAMVKKAVFAHNSKSWSHALGGHLHGLGDSLDNIPKINFTPIDFSQDNSFGQLGSSFRQPVSNGFNVNLITPEMGNTSKGWEDTIDDWGLKINRLTNPLYGLPIPQPRREKSAKTDSNWESWLRYAPVVGSLGNVITDLIGVTNKPDYRYADALDDAAANAISNYNQVSYTPLGDYLTYNPFDRLFYANELGAQQAATRRNIINLSNGNRGAALAGLLEADYKDNIALGDLYRKAEEYNQAQRQAVANFNRGTNQFNSESDFKAQAANAELNKAKAALLFDAAVKSNTLRQAEDQTTNTAKATNLTNLFENIGNIGWEAANRNMITTNPALYYSIDSSGKIHYNKSFNNLPEEDKEYVKWSAERASKKNSKEKANGGYLTIKDRRIR